MKILGMEIPPKGKKGNSNIESTPALPEALPGLWEKCEEYLGARQKFAQTLQNGTALDQVRALKHLQDTTKIYAGDSAEKSMEDYRNVFSSLQKVNTELYTAYSDMEDTITEQNNYSPEEIESYTQGDLSLLKKDGKPLFNPEEMAAIIEYKKDPADKEHQAMIVKLVNEMGRKTQAQDYAKAAAIAGFFMIQGLAPNEALANTFSPNFAMEQGSEFLGNPVTLSLYADQYSQEAGRGSLLGSTRTPYYHKTTLVNLGIPNKASIDLSKMKGLVKVPASAYGNAYTNTQDKDGNYWAYDGFRDGQAWLVKITAEELAKLTFVEYAGALYLETAGNGKEACGNIWIPVVVNDRAPDNGQLARPPAPPAKVERENNLVAKRGLENQWFLENPVTRTEQLIGRCVEIEEFNLDANGGNSPTRITKLYLVKQIEKIGGKSHTYWKIVDGDADFNTYYPINNIVKGRFTEGYNGLNGTSFTVPVPEDLRGTAKEIELASALLGLEVRE
ncbi:MAG: hypothetical protein KGZ39_08680 [Simkania sp.]|nr:hypothetical protein [Simkania sp.]MBS3905383.1 hypothetical protein [Simkania sp.]